MNKRALITGSGGLIGSEAVRYFSEWGMEVVGVDNNMRQYFFGPEGSTLPTTHALAAACARFIPVSADIRDQAVMESLFRQHGPFDLVVHTAAQPSHDWAAREPLTDFTVNAQGTAVLLEMTRRHSPEAVFIFTSTNKVYGDRPNQLPLVEKELRWEIAPEHPFQAGIDESMSIDATLHSVFGASKVAADILVQEYGRYFGLKTGVFRGGCLTGPAHQGVELHGFLSYLTKCVVSGRTYRIMGYKGKQVRDNIHSHDLITAFDRFYQNPRPGEVYNMGGSRHSHCSLLEAVQLVEKLSGCRARTEYEEKSRIGDHIWYVSDIGKFQRHYPDWRLEYNVERILEEIVRAETDPRVGRG